MHSCYMPSKLKTLLPVTTLIAVILFLLRLSESPTPQDQTSHAPQPEQIATATRAPTFVEPLDSRENGADQTVHVSQNWVAQNPHAALAQAAALEDESERQSAINAACLEIAQSDPALAVETLEKFDPAPDSRILEDLTQLWSAADSAAAADWVLSRPAGADRDRLLARVAYVIAESDPYSAAHLLIENSIPGEAQTEAAISILHCWALTDSTTATQWVELFPAGPLRDRAQSELTSLRRYTEALSATR
jgi:hypothetical protein